MCHQQVPEASGSMKHAMLYNCVRQCVKTKSNSNFWQKRVHINSVKKL
jgi:hypothetical protein